MLETIDLTRRLSKEEYKASIPRLRNRLYDLQNAMRDHQVPAVIAFEGWDASGRGAAINLLTRRLDPRGFRLHAVVPPRTYETLMPWLWRFWVKLPNYGEITIFDRSWYRRVSQELVEGQITEADLQKAYRDIVGFERMLADDGHIVHKFFFHISCKEQAKRFKKLEADPHESWRITPKDWKQHRQYDDYRLSFEAIFERTDTEWGPWTIVEATDRRWARAKVFESLISRFEDSLANRDVIVPVNPEDTGEFSVRETNTKTPPGRKQSSGGSENA
jgi:polyphosphate kinase 2 (PPK2 family)